MHDQMHAGRVHDPLVVCDVAMKFGDLARALEEQAVTELHDVGFMNSGDAFATVAPRVIKRKTSDAT